MRAACLFLSAILYAMALTDCAWAQAIYDNAPPCAQPLPQGEDFTFLTDDHVKIAGTFYYPLSCLQDPQAAKGKKYPAVLMLHMWKRDRKEWLGLTKLLQAQDFAVMTIDFRGHGESVWRANGQPLKNWDFAQITTEAAQAYRLLIAKDLVDPDHLSIVGASLGGTKAC